MKGLVTQIFGWYNEPVKVHANTNSYIALGNNVACSSSFTFRYWKCSFQKVDASAGGVVTVVVTSACFWRVGYPSPFLKDLLKPHNISDLVRFLWRIHGGKWNPLYYGGLGLFQLAIYQYHKGLLLEELMVMGLKPGFLFGWLAPIYRRHMLSWCTILKGFNSISEVYIIFMISIWHFYITCMHEKINKKMLSKLGWVKRQVAFPMLRMWVISASQSFPSTSPFFVLKVKSTVVLINLNQGWLGLRDLRVNIISSMIN